MHLKILKSRFYYFAVIVALALLVFFIPRAPDKQHGKVKDVIDGDTIELLDGRMVRYIGVDAPRIKVQRGGEWMLAPQPFAQEARQFNEALVLNKPIRLEFDVTEKDQFGRVLAYCFVKTEENEITKEVLVNEALLREGLAYVFFDQSNAVHLDDFFQAQHAAQHAQKNIWAAQSAISPKEARYFINERKIVEGEVVAASETRRTVELLFHRRRKSYLKIVIFKNSLAHFQRLNINPKTFYTRKKIRAFGLIRDYSGPEMEVVHPFQIEIID